MRTKLTKFDGYIYKFSRDMMKSFMFRHLCTPMLELEDLVQAGRIGVIEGERNHKPELGASLETYTFIRIRGNIIDEVRNASYLTRGEVKDRMSLEMFPVCEDTMVQKDTHVSDVTIERALDKLELVPYEQRVFDNTCLSDNEDLLGFKKTTLYTTRGSIKSKLKELMF